MKGDDLGDAFPSAETRVRSSARKDAVLDEEPILFREERRAEGLMAMMWASRSEGDPHLVTVVRDPRGRRLQCVCTSAAIRGDCWAVIETRRLLGWPEVTPEE